MIKLNLFDNLLAGQFKITKNEVNRLCIIHRWTEPNTSPSHPIPHHALVDVDLDLEAEFMCYMSHL